MVDHRQPLPGAVRPVLAEHRPLAVNVLDQAQSVAGDAAVGDDDLSLLAGLQLATGSGMRSRSAACVKATVRPPTETAETVIPLPAGSRRQVEEHLADAVGQLERDGRVACNPIRAVVDGQAEDVVDRVHARLPRVGIGVAGHGHQKSGDRDHRRSETHDGAV